MDFSLSDPLWSFGLPEDNRVNFMAFLAFMRTIGLTLWSFLPLMRTRGFTQ